MTDAGAVVVATSRTLSSRWSLAVALPLRRVEPSGVRSWRLNMFMSPLASPERKTPYYTRRGIWPMNLALATPEEQLSAHQRAHQHLSQPIPTESHKRQSIVPVIALSSPRTPNRVCTGSSAILAALPNHAGIRVSNLTEQLQRLRLR